MKRLLLLCLCVWSVNATKNELNLKKCYKLYSEWCTYRGVRYQGSITLDLSNQGLYTLDGIASLLVEYKNCLGSITSIPRLRILAHNNNLTTLPEEITQLDLIAIDVQGNGNFRVPNWVYEKPFFYVYYSDDDSYTRMIKRRE